MVSRRVRQISPFGDIVKVNNDFINEYVKDIFKPGAVLVSYGMRGGGKTHCAVSYCQRLIEGYYPDTPKHVVLVTNVIFIRKTKNDYETRSPPGVYTIHTMKDLFPIVVETFEKYGRKDTLIILLLDEAQNFLLGDMNNVGDMAASMKKFCGIIRKFNLCLWLISPAMRNLGPAFRNFLDADNDPGNVNCTFQKNTIDSKRFIAQRHYEIDPRSIVYVRPGYYALTCSNILMDDGSGTSAGRGVRLRPSVLGGFHHRGFPVPCVRTAHIGEELVRDGSRYQGVLSGIGIGRVGRRYLVT